MKEKLKKVYYCDFCKKKGMSKYWILEHEKSCSANPNRKCGVCGKLGISKKEVKKIEIAYDKMINKRKKNNIGYSFNGEDVKEFKDKIDELQDRLDCPMCAFSILRQSKIEMGDADFQLSERMTEWWKEEAENEYYSQDY